MEFEKHVKVRQEKFGAVLFETLREKVFVTNESGAEILRLLEAGKTVADIGIELAEKYNCDLARIKADTDELVLLLKENNIINSGEQK
jgi:hypothetical protein